MPRKYDPKIKEAFLGAARQARRAHKTWDEALVAAKAAGYKGSRPSLVRMYQAAAKPVRKAAVRGGKRGRRPAAAPWRGKDMGAIAAMVDSLVRERVRKAINAAIEALQGAKRKA